MEHVISGEERDLSGRRLSWREFAVSRSLETARSRAEQRVQRFIEAAQELVTTAGTDFTVQEVVERSGQSLRSFYQHFGGKHDLLLALFEESVASSVDVVWRRIEPETDPLERLHKFVLEYHELCRPGDREALAGGPPQIMAVFAWQLLTEHPREAARAFAPLGALFADLIEDAVAAGVVRGNLGIERLTGVVLEVIMFNAFSLTIAGLTARDAGHSPAEELWELLFHGLAPSTRAAGADGSG